ncbi:hypothetical protein PhaeoP128_01068 [Phaeobacter gallaeciensis]|nr:hypothetical protein PhaeoP129_01068 [Phaeobacter gallaeciensis]ATF21823.1 hypothetical protein PhaeoP128_01068 [Phaeobacter gallaeciensis]
MIIAADILRMSVREQKGADRWVGPFFIPLFLGAFLSDSSPGFTSN